MEINLKSFDLTGKVAIITGGNTGLGLAYTKALANCGADIMVVGHIDDFKEVKQYVESKKRRFYGYVADLTNQDAIKQLVENCLKEYGTIDILVNNAGTIRRSPLLEYSKQDWDMVLGINLDATFYLSQEVSKIMVENKKGKIINIASMLSFQGGKFVPAYTASKHAVAGLTKAFANELAIHNIQVNAVAPGYVITDNTKQIREDETRNKEILSRIPANYWAEADDIAGAVVFLASNASNYVNGHILAVDGGWLAR